MASCLDQPNGLLVSVLSFLSTLHCQLFAITSSPHCILSDPISPITSCPSSTQNTLASPHLTRGKAGDLTGEVKALQVWLNHDTLPLLHLLQPDWPKLFLEAGDTPTPEPGLDIPFACSLVPTWPHSLAFKSLLKSLRKPPRTAWHYLVSCPTQLYNTPCFLPGLSSDFLHLQRRTGGVAGRDYGPFCS